MMIYMKTTDTLRLAAFVKAKYIYGSQSNTPKETSIFNGSMNAEDLLEWIAVVDNFFYYYDIPDDGSLIDRVIYGLRGRFYLVTSSRSSFSHVVENDVGFIVVDFLGKIDQEKY
ncbi:hypothetical protein CDL15_Pgr011633 [Punica granatum]|uniref:Uncharacterized protein n=1 Tax=Punica granatum TaxID=22663 RepID=A0A218XHG3_PUNGR|nr:hypothetical protein CDL15_Pgr011633 [Punica granatum]